jgi:hypothetical protein
MRWKRPYKGEVCSMRLVSWLPERRADVVEVDKVSKSGQPRARRWTGLPATWSKGTGEGMKKGLIGPIGSEEASYHYGGVR